MRFQKLTQWINENAPAQDITVLYPGGFKPMTGGHLDLIERYDSHPSVKEVKVLVGPGVRNGIDQNLAYDIAVKLTSHLKNVTIEKSKYPSPILTAYKTIEEAKPGNYALGASSKGDDYKRVRDFTDQHQPDGKYAAKVPEGVFVVELAIESDPAVFQNRKGVENHDPISASTLRKDVIDGDRYQFASGYPNSNPKQIDAVWNALKGKVLESINLNKSLNLNESVVPKVNKHMTHAEDLVVLSGSEGLEWVSQMMWDLYGELKGSTPASEMTLSVKIDGAPAIFAYSEFPGLPKYGIAMKGLFAKVPKVFTTKEEIMENFGDRPDLAYKLVAFLKHLPKLGIPANEIWQGDFLFDNKSITETSFDGEDYYAFHPNTIYYVIPKDSDLGKLVKKAEIGITWHTRYTGSDLENVSAKYDAKASELTMVDSVLMTDPYIKSFAGIANFTEEETTKVESMLSDITEISNDLKHGEEYADIVASKDIISIFSIFQNSLIKVNKKIDDPSGYLGEFIEFVQNRGAKAADKLKSEKGKEKAMIKFAGYIDDIEQHKDMWYVLIHTINSITELKELFIKKLNNIGTFQTYLKMKEGGLRSTNQEGFAVSDKNGNVVKLVDRGEFSWSNFSPEVQKGWEK